MTHLYYRPIPLLDVARPAAALPLAGGPVWFAEVEVLSRQAPARILPAAELPAEARDRLCAPRAPLAGLPLDRPRLMGILNVTPDSFSDGGLHADLSGAVAAAQAMAPHVDLIDVGGESTRPGAAEVPVAEEIARTAPVIAALRDQGIAPPISIDTRKAAVAQAALAAGAAMVNDVSGLGFDTGLAPVVAAAGVPLCLMHSIATPATMQDDPRYNDVLLDVYDALANAVARATAAGIARDRIVLDPGIGFGKTVAHNLALLRRVSLFHALGCPILLGVSRKRFIGTLGQAAEPRSRGPGSMAAALAAIAQGVQILRIHDTAEMAQALRLFLATTTGESPEEAT